MARIINLTLARNTTESWASLQKKNPYDKSVTSDIESLVGVDAFKTLIAETIDQRLTVDNADLICFIVEEYYQDLYEKLLAKKHIYYINERIKNTSKMINGEVPESYEYAFPQIKYKKDDSRINFLESILSFVELMDKDHQTITELFNTPIHQYEQMIHFISYYQHEKIPILLEKLSYFQDMDYIALTIKPIGQYKNENALNALLNLEKYYIEENPEVLPMIYSSLQKLAFNRPIINQN